MRTRPSASLARWGLLATTLVMATTLVATGIAGYRSAEEASRSIVRARSRDHTMALRRAMHHADGDRQQRLLTAFDEVRDQGVRAVALVGRRGRVVARAGVALDEAEIMEFIAGGTGRHEPVWVGDRARVVVSGGPPARARRPGARRGRRGRGPALLYLEFEPVVAQEVRDQAFRTLVIGSLAAALLLLVGLVFWRLSLRAQRAEAGLAHERRLAALGEMSAVLGHELKNPLAALKGHAQLLLERVPEDAGFLRTSAETVVRETVRLQRLTEQVLAFVRTGDVDRVEADPTGVAQRAIETLEERGVVTLRASTAPARWRLDPARIQQVLTNLLRNAEQAAPPGTPIDVEVAGSAREGLIYRVRDRGPGIGPGDEDTIFEPFQTGRVRGTGLGLTVARRIVEGHGGTIRAYNVAGEAGAERGGAVFEIRLPAVGKELS